MFLPQTLQLESKSPAKRIPLLLSLSINVILGLTVAALYSLVSKTNQELSLLTPTPTPTPNAMLQNKQELTNKTWYSPSGNKFLSYKYNSNSDEYRLILNQNGRELNLGGQSEVVADLEVTWSPNEDYILVAIPGNLNRIFCSRIETCRNTVVFSSYPGMTLIYWQNEKTAYIRYHQAGQDIISKLDFSAESGLPQEAILFRDQAGSRFAYRPTALSPTGRYLILEYAYEGPPSLSILDTAMGKIKDLRQNEQPYILADQPQYSWQGNKLTFQGIALNENNQNKLFDEDYRLNKNLIQTITVDVSR